VTRAMDACSRKFDGTATAPEYYPPRRALSCCGPGQGMYAGGREYPRGTADDRLIGARAAWTDIGRDDGDGPAALACAGDEGSECNGGLRRSSRR
jgi:hypothetical protein